MVLPCNCLLGEFLPNKRTSTSYVRSRLLVLDPYKTRVLVDHGLVPSLLESFLDWFFFTSSSFVLPFNQTTATVDGMGAFLVQLHFWRYFFKYCLVRDQLWAGLLKACSLGCGNSRRGHGWNMVCAGQTLPDYLIKKWCARMISPLS